MPIRAARPEQLRGRVFLGSDVVQRGLLTRKQLRSPAWRRLRQDVYADAALEVTHRLLISAVGLVLPAGAGFTGLSAAVLWGAADVAGPLDPVEVVLPSGQRWHPGAGVRVHRASRAVRLERVGRWECTDRVATTVGLVRRGPEDDAVVLLDRLLAGGMVRLDDVRDAVADLPRARGSAQARRVADLAVEFADSPQETRLRLVLVRAGLPTPVPQFRVFDAEGFVARVDLAYPELRIAVEYDGLWHADRRAFLDDRRRVNRLVAAGWVVLHVTADDLCHPEDLLARLRALRAGRLAEINAR
ncbi:hypothetical protein [Blastococcus sp. TF02-09]|uniref:hypothetical protein n=1 Tax=Blastococcus sp. TF02-09 TaxID=2250576 RepID=UPI001F2C951F|nr:hypothetical protein [Blastococcus sp. TF02-9]